MAGGLTIEWDVLDGPEAAEPSERASWAALRVVVEPHTGAPVVLTRVSDRAARAEREHVYGPLLPVCEWIARSWNHLAVGTRPAPSGGRAAYAWARTRSWRYAGEGAALPDLWFHPYGEDHLRLTWRRDDPHGPTGFEPVVFLESGEAVLPRDAVLRALQDLVTAALARLRETAPTDDWRVCGLADAWRLARDPAQPDAAAARLGARAGILWADAAAALRGRVRQLAAVGVRPVALALLERADQAGLEAALAEAATLAERCAAAPAAPEQWGTVRVAAFEQRPWSTADLPWDRGWAAARALRRTVGWGDDAPSGDLVAAVGFGFEAGPLTGNPGESLVAWAAGHAPVRARPQSDRPREARARFLLARDAYPMFCEGALTMDHARLLTEGGAGANPEANAFATELLAPVEWLTRRLAGAREIGEDALSELATELKAPLGCVKHQVENHGLARIRWVDG